MKAIILAAGVGKRLHYYTINQPKCLLKLGQKSLLAHQVDVLNKAGINDITVITGHLAEKIETLGYKTIHNCNYATTNMVASLMCASNLMDGTTDILISYGDIVCELPVIRSILECSSPLCTTIDRSWLRLWKIRFQGLLENAESLKLDASGNILEIGKHPKSLKEINGQYMGLIKIRAGFAPKFLAFYKDLCSETKDYSNMFMTSFLQQLIDSGQDIKAVIVSGGWIEVDTANDLELYNDMYKKGTLSTYLKILSK